ncbi:hypothetical protein OHA25_08420 [Nonomuraea sp. NBC_00507]|uniref:hypothetical protein n=1 Tax=Nonomuraea sp. NBC_00507 TaxID=2976002 RepID=UPI002E17671B
MSTDHAYEVDHDDYERLMGPPQEEPDEEPPLSLEEIQAAYDECGGKIWELGPSARTVAVGLLQLITEARAARAELERMRAGTRHEYTVTDGAPPADDAELVTAEQADAVLANTATAQTVWIRGVHAEPWQQLSKEPPF